MLKKTVTYNDYNEVERTDDLYFNLSEAELLEMETGISGGLSAMVGKIVKANDTPAIMKMFKEIILKSYGEKSPDGKRFIKSEELSTAFSQTEAYSQLYMELATDDKAAAEFINGLIPAKLAKKVQDSNAVSGLLPGA